MKIRLFAVLGGLGVLGVFVVRHLTDTTRRQDHEERQEIQSHMPAIFTGVPHAAVLHN
jgi:adenylate kinase